MKNSRPVEALQTIHAIGSPSPDASSENPVTETIYTNEIPPFVDATLERLYACVYCTLRRIEAYDSLERISTYVRKEGATITAVILFRIKAHVVSVINQQISFPAAKMLAFCDKLFRTFERVRVIRFYGIDASLDRFAFPFQQLESIEENIVQLPASKEQYLASLRPQFAKQIRAREEKIAQAYPSFTVQTADRGDIQEQHVTDILALATKRMIATGRATYSEKVDRTALMKTLKKYGHVVMATIDGRICAGSIFFSVGKKHFHAYIAHDPQYDEYMLGNQMWLAAILYSIELRGEECWLMGGARLHKSRFKAKPYAFNSITVYRSRFHALLHGPLLVDQWLKQKKRAFKAACKAELENQTPIGRLIEKSLVARNALQSKKTRL
jgi:hypothetical protein